MNFHELADLLETSFGKELILERNEVYKQPFLLIQTEMIEKVCHFLHTHSSCYFDFLTSITGVDNHPQENTLEVIYHLYSIPFNQHIILKVKVDRDITVSLPKVPTVTTIWKSANWHERETFDFFGIHFEGHPDLRRILLPANWEGFPMRKDYQAQEYFHGIKVAY